MPQSRDCANAKHLHDKNHPSAPMRLIRALENLERHPVLQKVTLNHVIQYARLICHLKNDILLPQPLKQSDPNIPLDVLPLSIVYFFELSPKNQARVRLG